MPQFLCRQVELPEGGSLRVRFDGDTHGHGMCLIRRDGQIYAYLNRCPHQQMPMDYLPGQFLDQTGTHIICSMHGASFQIETGHCLAGPCQGESLHPVKTHQTNGEIWLAD